MRSGVTDRDKRRPLRARGDSQAAKTKSGFAAQGADTPKYTTLMMAVHKKRARVM